MKDLYSVNIGGDGGKASIGVDGPDLALSVKFPLAKIVKPATDVLDAQLDKLKALIPGSWDDAAIDKFKAEYHAALLEKLSEQPA